jgi:hypothetical protein
MYNHYKTLKMVPPFQHEEQEDKEIFRQDKSYEEVLFCMSGTH